MAKIISPFAKAGMVDPALKKGVDHRQNIKRKENSRQAMGQGIMEKERMT